MTKNEMQIMKEAVGLLTLVDEKIEKLVSRKLDVLPQIERHLEKINGSVVDNQLSLKETDAIAHEANERSKRNSGNFIKLLLATIAAIGAVAAAIFQMASEL